MIIGRPNLKKEKSYMAKTHRVSGRAVVIKEGKILLTKFKNGLYYNFPGGGVEAGETLAECTKREVLEESGIAVFVEDMLFTLEVETKRYGIPDDPHISIFFRCVVDDNIPVVVPCKPDYGPDDPSIQAVTEWVPISKLKEINFLPYIPGNILEYVQTGEFTPKFLSGHFEK
jgi:8-oxo-dGTP pyrophosphatase MutT (NUDIX family)